MSEETKPIYDSRKPYTWTKDHVFELTGPEFDLIVRSLQANFDGNVFAAHVLQFEAYQATQQVVKRYVEAGVVKEVPVAPPPIEVPEVYKKPQEVYTDLEGK